ncbi:hypothetical protein BH23ACT2_BH23ACT2_13660 [soil metagenome]
MFYCAGVTDQPEQAEVLSAPLVIEYPFTRTTGPIVGAFLTGLRERVLVGSKLADGRVLVPPSEFDPITGHDTTELVEVGPTGVITTWAWVTEPHEKHPLDEPFAWALIRPEGADTPMLGAVRAPAMDAVATDGRVRPVWADEREGHIGDIACWALIDAGSGDHTEGADRP